MLPDRLRAELSKLVRRVAEQGAAAALCNANGEVEVSAGLVEPYLDALQQGGGEFLTTLRDRQVFVGRNVGGFRLVAAVDSQDSLGDVIGESHSILPELEVLLNPDDPGDGPAAAAAMRVRKRGAA